MVIFKKIFAVMMITMALITFGLNEYMVDHYIDTSPRKPMPNIGRIYPLQEHYTIVYLTKNENLFLQWLKWGSFGLVLMIIVFVAIFKPFASRQKRGRF